MKTTTATKTAVAWMIVGGLAALAASMALGLPWKNNLDDGITSKRVTNAVGKILCQTGSVDCSGKEEGTKCGRIDSNGQYSTCKVDILNVSEVWCSCSGPKVSANNVTKGGIYSKPLARNGCQLKVGAPDAGNWECVNSNGTESCDNGGRCGFNSNNDCSCLFNKTPNQNLTN